MGKLFGTDGARGVVGQDLTTELAMRIGRAAASVLTERTHHRPKVLIGKDTRISGDMLEAALAAGLCSVGADVVLVGVIPTPAVAYLVRLYKCDAGVVISASHNPVEFNGIKIFSGDGYKLPDQVEASIEELVFDPDKGPRLSVGGEVGRIYQRTTAVEDYVAHILECESPDLRGLRIGIDCGNGAASETAKRLFDQLGAKCYFLGAAPDGCNINEGCGSTHLAGLSRFVVENQLDCGIAFDGDADRCLAVDETGAELDGDMIIAIFARALRERGTLAGNTAVVTVMSNLGFMEYMKEQGIATATTAVGDRYVLEEMRAHGHVLGGEQSGHVILLDYNTTGDGQMTAVMLLGILAESGLKMSELGSLYKKFPQVLVNLETTAQGKQKFKEDEYLEGYIESQQQQLIGLGRVLVRLSGTEPLIRVMVEGRNQDEIEACAHRIADKIKERIG